MTAKITKAPMWFVDRAVSRYNDSPLIRVRLAYNGGVSTAVSVILAVVDEELGQRIAEAALAILEQDAVFES